jgi:hypothetical protein
LKQGVGSLASAWPSKVAEKLKDMTGGDRRRQD